MTEAILAILLIAGGIGLDRWVKDWSVRVLKPAGSIPLREGVFHLTYAENQGAAFSMLHGARWLLIAVTGAVLLALIAALCARKIPKGLARWGVYCILAGAIGNLIDRIAQGYVVDLFDFRLIHFAVFNVADVFVCTGGGLIALWAILSMIREGREGKKP